MPSERIDEWLTEDFGYQVMGTLLHRERTKFQLLEIWQSATFGKMLRLDGALQCSEQDEYFYHEPIVHLSALAHERPESALIIGGGDGGAAEELLKHPDVKSIVVVEIDERVVALSRLHLTSVHRGSINPTAPRVQVVHADGKLFLQETAQTFDLIILDLTDPGGASIPLYELDFYQLCETRLRPGGFLSLHLGGLWPHAEVVHQRLATLRECFNNVEPFVFSVPMSGGPWVMARCHQHPVDDLARAVHVAEDRVRRLDGPRLRYIGPRHLAALNVPLTS